MDLCSLFDPSWSSRNAILCLFDVSGVSLSQYLEGDGGVPGSIVYKECQSQDADIIVSVSVSFPSSRFYRQGRYCQLNPKPAVNVQLPKHRELISLNVLLKIN